MAQEYTKDNLVKWYREHRNPADRIINDLAKQTHEGIMHIYAYTAKMAGISRIVSQQDFPTLFSNNYTRVNSTLSGIRAQLLHEWNLKLGKNTIQNALAYWLLCGNMFETLVSKLITRSQAIKDKLKKKTILQLINSLVDSSIQNGFKDDNAWQDIVVTNKDEGTKTDSSTDDNICGDADKAEHGISEEEAKPQIPQELDNEKGCLILNRAIERGLCDKEYHWLKTKSLLAYFAQVACEKLGLSNAEQDDDKKTAWKPFEQFSITRIRKIARISM